MGASAAADTTMPESPSFARRVAAVAVGLFALWELAFIPAANLIDLVHRRPGPDDTDPVADPFQSAGTFTSVEPVQRAAERIGDVLDFWSEVTGQDQGWKLFSPGSPPHSLFAAVEFHDADGTVTQVRSRFEPADLSRPPVRTLLVPNRYYNFEAQFTTPGWYCSAESLAQYPDMWASELPKTVRDNHRHTTAWLRWHTRLYRAAHPGRGEPVAVVLLYRFIPTPDPNDSAGWSKPVVERPYARWLPGGPAEPGCLALEGYDPVAGRYVRFPVEGTR